MSVHRIRTDFQFAMIVLLGLVMVMGVLPFSIFRFWSGQPLIGAIDLGLVLAVCTAVGYLWRGGNVELVGVVLVATLDLALVVLSALAGASVAAWAYPLLLANFLLVTPRHAVLLALLTVLGISLYPETFDDGLKAAEFAATATTVSVFAWVFTHRAQRQQAQLQVLATLDALTGAFNRRAMAHEVQRAIDLGGATPLGLAVFDVDHFKHINDAHGHDAGDRVLVELARLVARVTRKTDRFFRLGGEEFMLLLPGTDAAALATVCEGLRGAVAGQLQVGGRAVTISIGAAMRAPDEPLSDWLARADAAMYRAKREGRDRVVVDSAAEAPVTASVDR